MTSHTGAQEGERGAALVEFAIVLPLLITLLFGIIEASWAFAQHNDVRHGAREGARLAATNFGDLATVGQEVCDRMDLVYSQVQPDVTLTPMSADGRLGGLAEVKVEANLNTLTGLLDAVFGSVKLKSEIQFRLEQPFDTDAAWWNGGSGGTYTCT